MKENQVIEWNPGQLPPAWSLERLLAKHSSQPANPDIANAFFRAGKIESWGRGIDLIRNDCLEEGYPAPSFSCDSSGLWIEFTFPKKASVNTDEATGQVTGQVDQWVLRVVEACSTKDLKSSEIQEMAGIRHRETFQRNYLDKLLEDELLERTIPDKPNSRLQRYRLTEKGKLLLETLRKGNLP
jgi:predicted HTH transcriptional regulator